VSSSLAFSDESLENVKTLRKWLKKNGGYIGKVDIQYFSDQGRGMVAVEDIQVR
jgi:hypothetical protein